MVPPDALDDDPALLAFDQVDRQTGPCRAALAEVVSTTASTPLPAVISRTRSRTSSWSATIVKSAPRSLPTSRRRASWAQADQNHQVRAGGLGGHH